MSKTKETSGAFYFDKDTLRNHRFQVESDDGFFGIIYLPKKLNDGIPKKIVLVYKSKNDLEKGGSKA